ncbi:MAG: hypothetical protein JWS10_2361 [Cypionkella sp.]|uniref:hypothetical protein n=1 Tax=Cypionkella sp. TaxID=2811411 RepID=UPI0026170BF9|nr:hypothetical protein [Cypionkella sp.]MDB5659746.1 hypothetical protein [Cypionkella sp.]MDB5665245.1 hypothetical protein [Cypionkella sp.]
MRYSTLIALPFTLYAGLASAEATPEGAAALTATLQTYLGSTEGVVTVTPDDDYYDVSLDLAPLIAKAPSELKSTVSPIEFTLTDNGDGTWEMEQDQALDFTLLMPGAADVLVKIGNIQSTGTFDAALQTFTTSTTTATDIAVTEKMIDPNTKSETNVAYSLASMKYDSTATAGAAGGVDSTATYEATGLSETMTIPDMGMPVTLTAETQSGTADFSGLRPDAFYKLLAFAVANPDPAAAAAQQATLKDIIKDGLPLFAHLGTTGLLSNLKVETPMGTVGLTDMSLEVEMNGLVDDGMFREAATMNGLTLPAGLVPEWAAQLVPTSLAFDFKASRFNLAAPVAILLDTVDLINPAPNTPEQDQALLAALLPDGVVDITLAPGNVTSPLYTVTYEGMFSAGPATPMPVGKATVTATGLTAVEQALAAGPPELTGQITPMLKMAESMAKPGENGALVWELESTATGGLLVNGTNMMGAQ